MFCPTECPDGNKYFDALRTSFCDGCPQQREREKFKNEAAALTLDFLGETTFDFDRIERILYETISLKELPPEKMSAKTAVLVRVYQAEECRWEKIKKKEEKPSQTS